MESGQGAIHRLSPRRPRRLLDSAQPALLPELLEPLGWHRVGEVEGERGETIWYISGPGSSLGLREAQTPPDGPFDRYRVGVHHVAFEAPSRIEVDERADWLRGRGAEIESGPEEYSYIPGYYAVFFYDPDGIKLEIVHVPGHAA